MELAAEIAEAQACIDDAPKNESNTCEWVILPLLWAAGYARREIVSRTADSTGQFPDYTLLPNSSATWYLEAKAWSVPLEDLHAKQALNYANQNGERFVVLTNGQRWRLYDNGVQGLISAKLVTEVRLENTEEVTSFLLALCRDSVISGGLERLAEAEFQRRKAEAAEAAERQQRAEEERRRAERQIELCRKLDEVIPRLLSDPGSDLTQALTAYIANENSLDDLAPDTVSRWFTTRFTGPPWVRDGAVERTNRIEPSRPTSNAVGRELRMKALAAMPVDGKSQNPVALQMPDKSTVVVRSWVSLAVEAIRWLMINKESLPLPFESSHRTRWFLNDSPIHKRPELRRKFKSIAARGKTVYMDSDRSGQMLLQDLCALCSRVGIDANDFVITLSA